MADTVLVVGAGSIGRRHFDNLKHLGARAELMPWRSFDAKTVSERRDIVAMVIATQTPVRLELITLCAQNDWPFYAEKPLAWTKAQVAKIYDAAAPVAARSMVGFMMRYHPVLRALAAMDLSRVFRIHAEIGHDVRKWRANWQFSTSYAAQAQGGGVLLDLCHEIDLVAALFAPLTLQDGRSMGHRDFAGVDFATSLHVTTAQGAAGHIAMDYLSPVFTRKMVLSGLDMRIEADFQTATLNVQRLDQSGQAAQVTQTFPFQRNDMFIDAMRDFLAIIAAQPPSHDPLRPCFDTMRSTCDLIAHAWETRRFSGNVDFDVT